MLLRLKLFIIYLLSKRGKVPEVKTEKKKIVIALAANYGNLGDVAITLAQKRYLIEHFPDYEVFEFKITDTFTRIKSLKAVIKPDDIITIVGGGNMGDTYDDIELCRQLVIQSFPNNKIVIFPQTISFSESFAGRAKLFLAKIIYNRHKNLTIFARERFSYEKYKEVFRGRVKLVPDIVMSMERPEVPDKERSGVILCFRNDREDGLDSDYKSKLINGIQSVFESRKRDTHIGASSGDLEQLYGELEELLEEFEKASVVVTDRLHGMILSYICHTPCVVFWGNNKKILGSWEWIAESNYVRVIDNCTVPDEKDVISCISELSKLTSEEKQTSDLKMQYSKIYEVLRR